VALVACHHLHLLAGESIIIITTTIAECHHHAALALDVDLSHADHHHHHLEDHLAMDGECHHHHLLHSDHHHSGECHHHHLHHHLDHHHSGECHHLAAQALDVDLNHADHHHSGECHHHHLEDTITAISICAKCHHPHHHAMQNQNVENHHAMLHKWDHAQNGESLAVLGEDTAVHGEDIAVHGEDIAALGVEDTAEDGREWKKNQAVHPLMMMKRRLKTNQNKLERSLIQSQ